MGIIVQKFGGSSVANLERLELVSEHIIEEVKKGNKVVVVVSAQGKTTDRLISEEAEITENPDRREHDVLVSTGEQITIAKLAMLLIKKKYKAVSLTGWQIPIVTNSEFSNSRVRYIHNQTINDYLNSGNIVIVAGFQGVDESGNITTFGRGGSDTTAVALAASLKAEKCDIYTDVDGVYTSDPRIVNDVKKLKSISYDEMLEMSSMGAKVLHNRCVEIGKKYNVPIYVDIIVQSFGEHITKDIAFTVKMNDLQKTLEVLEENKEVLGAQEILHSENLSKVSIIGVGIANKPGVAADMFEALYENNINMHMISTSEIKISVLVNSEEADLAVRAIHDKFFKN